MEGDSLDDDLEALLSSPKSESPEAASTTPSISEQEFFCHCCYDILVNPTTLTCGHSFCRHCLALWWESSRKNECPECREKWEGFPKVNILLRDATNKLFSSVVQQRRTEIQANPKLSRSLLAFQRYGDNLGRSKSKQSRGAGIFFSGVLTALSCVAVMVLVFHWSAGVDDQHDPLISKAVSRWTPEEVLSWLDQLGTWAQLYREPFQQENVNGRLLLMLGEEELLKPPFNVENQAHRRAVLAELDRIKLLGVKPPQNLWEYKEANAGKSLFLLYSLKRSPRLTLFYLYLFDYTETFLPFLHTCCPALTPAERSESIFLHTQVTLHQPTFQVSARRRRISRARVHLLLLRCCRPQLEPSLGQWTEFLLKYLLLPYQLIAEFAWDWLAVHYWTSRFVIVNTVLLSLLEGCALWRLWVGAEIRYTRLVVTVQNEPIRSRICASSLLRSLPNKMWSHVWKMLSQGFAFAVLWPFIPQFVCNCLFYWALYLSPIINIDLVVRHLMHPETQAL